MPPAACRVIIVVPSFIIAASNTTSLKSKSPLVSFRLEGDYTDIKDIPIAVNGVELRAESGKAPGKLCCPTNCEWTDERENIEKRYQNFQSNIKTGVDWWK